jgi:ferritin-like metal-binding protein YciE
LALSALSPRRAVTISWANELGLGDAVGLLDATLQEEKNRRDLDEDCGKLRFEF